MLKMIHGWFGLKVLEKLDSLNLGVSWPSGLRVNFARDTPNTPETHRLVGHVRVHDILTLSYFLFVLLLLRLDHVLLFEFYFILCTELSRYATVWISR